LDDAEREGQEEIANYITERMRFFLPRELMNSTSSDPSDFSAMQVCSSGGETKKSSESQSKKKEKEKKSKKKKLTRLMQIDSSHSSQSNANFQVKVNI
jgi:hypothetical protein